MKSNASLLIKSFKSVLKVFFSLTCFFLAGYMTFLQFQAYFANEDSSVVTYKEFNQDNTNVYPTFTICFQGHRGEIFRNSFNQSLSHKYYETVRGNLEDRDNLTLLEFEDKVIKLMPMIDSFGTRTKEGKKIFHVNPLNKSSSHSIYGQSIFSTTYHDAQLVCYTKERKLGEVSLSHRDNLKINSEQMMRNKYNLYFYIHQRGQLLRNIGSPNYILDHQKMAEKKRSFSYMLTLRISSVDVIVKR